MHNRRPRFWSAQHTQTGQRGESQAHRHPSLVARRGDLPGVRPELPGQHRRRHRRSGRGEGRAAVSEEARCRRDLAEPLLPLAAARPRVRRGRLLRRRPALRRPRRVRPADDGGPAAGREGAAGHRPQPLLQRAPVVPRGARLGSRQRGPGPVPPSPPRRRGRRAPNNWHSMFGGPAWTRVVGADGRPGQWYLHMFTPEQPDWNWRNGAVAAEFERVLRFWLDRGVDGFRIDVAAGLFKHPGLPDSPCPRPTPAPATRSTRLPGTSPRCTTCGGTGVRCVRSTRRGTATNASWWARCPCRPPASTRATSARTSCTRPSSSIC